MPSLFTILVAGAAPEVDYGFTADLNTQSRPAFVGIVEEFGKGFAYCFEFKLEMTLNLPP